MLQDAAHILFRHIEVDGSRWLQTLRGLALWNSPSESNLLQRLTGNFRMRFRPGDDDTNALAYLANVGRARRGCIGIAVTLDRLIGPRLIQRVEDLNAPPPVCDAGALQMGDNNRHLALAADLEYFAHGLDDCFSFRAHVRYIDRACGCERFGQR